MSKTRVTVGYQQTPAPSAQMNEMITDYIVPPKMVASWQMLWDSNFTLAHANTQSISWFPYNPLKSVYDTMRVHAIAGTSGAGVSITPRLYYSLDSGASWTLITTLPANNVILPLSLSMGSTANHNYWDVPLGGITSFQHVGLQWQYIPGIATWIESNVWAYLISSADPPLVPPPAGEGG